MSLDTGHLRRAASGDRAVPSSGSGRAAIVRALPLLSLALTLLLGAWLRLQSLDYVEFGNDQAWVLNRAYDLVSGKDFPLAGIVTSTGAFQGPVEVYLLAIPVAISKDPRYATVFVALLQLAAIAGTYALGKCYFGTGAGLIAAFLFAVNPWALQYSRKVWTPDLLPILSVLMLYALAQVLIERRRWWAAVALPLQMAMFMTHPSTILFAPLVAGIVLIRWRRSLWSPLLLGLGLALVVAAPYLVYESARNFHSLEMYLRASGAPAQVDLQALQVSIRMASAALFPMMMGYGFRDTWWLPTLADQDTIVTLLLYAGIALCLWQTLRAVRSRGLPGRAWQTHMLLLLWFVLPIAGSIRHSLTVHPHYFIGTYPAQFLLVGIALAGAAGWLPRAFSRGPAARYLAALMVLAVVAFVALAQVDLFRQYLSLVQTNGPTRLYGVPLRYTEKAIANATSLSAVAGGAPVYAYAYKQRDTLAFMARPSLDLRVVDPPEGLVLPYDTSKGAVALLASDDGNTAERDYGLVAKDSIAIRRLTALGFVESTNSAVLANDGYAYYRFFTITPEALVRAVAGFANPAAPLALGNGATLLGYNYPRAVSPGERFELATLWRFPTTTNPDLNLEQNVFVHVTDRQGKEAANVDREAVPYRTWRADDIAIIFHDLTLPADQSPAQFWFDLGMYERIPRQEVPWLDAAGKPTGAALKVGPVALRPAPGTPVPQKGAAFAFGSDLRLLGYDLPAALKPGAPASITLYWQALAAVKSDYTVSLQLLDRSGKLAAQHDSPPVGGNYPTSAWKEGDNVSDVHPLALPAETAPGEYSLVVVVYDPSTQKRLMVSGANGTPLGDHVTLGSVTIP